MDSPRNKKSNKFKLEDLKTMKKRNLSNSEFYINIRLKLFASTVNFDDNISSCK